MAIEDAQHFHEMQMQNHARDIEEARARSQRDAIAMVEDTHQRNPFDDGGATLALMGRDTTASAVQLMQFAIEDHASNVSTRWPGPYHAIIPKLGLDGTAHPKLGFNGTSRTDITSPPPLPLLLIILYPLRLTVRNAQELMAQQLFHTVALRVHHQLGETCGSTGRANKDSRKAVTKVTPSEPPPGADAGRLEELEGNDTNKKLRVLHRHPQRIEIGTERESMFQERLLRRSWITFWRRRRI